MIELLRSPFARRFFLAHLQSQVGTGAAYVGLVLVAYQRLHSGWAIALVLLADFLPGTVLAAPFGALADRMSRRRLVVTADLIRAGAFLGLAVVPSFATTVGLALVAGIGTALFQPAVGAALPGLVAPEQRSSAAALWSAMINAGVTLGPAVTAAVLLFSSATAVLAANAATFAVSALLLASVPLGRGSGSDDELGSGSLWRSTRAGTRAAAAIPGIPALLLIGACSILAGALMNVAEPLLATGPLHAGKAGYSLLVAVYGIGLVTGSFVSRRSGDRIASMRRWLLGGLALNGVGMLGSAVAGSLGWAVVTFALTGLFNAFIMTPELRLFQELVSERLLGRVFGLREMLGNVAFVAAFLSAGVLLAVLGPRALFAVGGAGLVVLAGAGALWFRPRPSVAVSPGAVAVEPEAAPSLAA
jgi:MFS family permease